MCVEQKVIEELLREGKTIQIQPTGWSMYPLFVPERDHAVIKQENLKSLKRGDVVLYRRESGILVLHRIWKRKKSGFYMVGDNQTAVEGPLREEQIKGKMIALDRNGKQITVKNPLYLILSLLWLRLRPFRRGIARTVAWFRKCRKRKNRL